MFLVAVVAALHACEHDPFPAPPPGMNDTIIPNPNDTTTPIDTTDPNDTTVTNTDPCHPDTVYFTKDILPILATNCANSGCHDAATAQDGVILNSYGNVINTAKVKGGDLDAGKLYEYITESDPDKRMPPPPNTPLSSSDIALIRKWILQGAQNLTCQEDTVPPATLSFSNDIHPIFQQSCAPCHSGPNAPNGLLLTNYTQIKNGIQNNEVIQRINHQPGFNPMPPSGIKLSVSKLNKIDAWVAAGLPNN